VSLECARVLSKAAAKTRFPATIVFLTVAGEEQGLNGSKHFAQMAKQQGWKLEAVLNNDIVGGNLGAGQDAGVVRVFSEGLPQLRPTLNPADSQARRRKRLDFTRSRSLYRRRRAVLQCRSEAASHLPARPLPARRRPLLVQSAGVCRRAVHGISEDFNHQHQNVRSENGIEYGDLPKFVDFEYVAHVTQLNAATLASLARLQRCRQT